MSDFPHALAEAAQLPVLHHTSRGFVQANPVAKGLLPAGTEEPPTLEGWVAELSQSSINEATHAIAEARQRQPGKAIGIGFRVLRAGDDTFVLVPDPVLARRHASDAARAHAAASVSHEMGNALSAIVGWAQLGRAGAREPQEALNLIESAGRTARATAERLLDQSTSGEAPAPVTEPIDLHTVVDALVRLMEPAAVARRISLTHDVGRGTVVRASTSIVHTALSNIVQNALQAIGKRGSVHVTADVENDDVILRVSDDGPGIDPALGARIFDAYVTGKSDGTGLGLSLARDAVKEVGGDLTFETVPSEGTRFDIKLPRAAAVRRPGRRTPAQGQAAASPVRIESGVLERLDEQDAQVLVVEDDEVLRAMMNTAIEIRGAKVTSVRTVAEARALSGPFHVAFVDLTLPDGRGDDLLADLAQRELVYAAAIVSGSEPSNLAPNHTWLRKPFEVADLQALVHELFFEQKKRRSASVQDAE